MRAVLLTLLPGLTAASSAAARQLEDSDKSGDEDVTAKAKADEPLEVEDYGEDKRDEARDESSPFVNAIVLLFITGGVGYRYFKMHQQRQRMENPDMRDEGIGGMMRMMGLQEERRDHGIHHAGHGMRVVHVILPADAEVGQTRQLVAEPTGEIVEIQVPAGRGPGDILAVEIPAGPMDPTPYGRRMDWDDPGRRPSDNLRNRASGAAAAQPPVELRRSSSRGEMALSVLVATDELTPEEWLWLKVIFGCTVWLTVWIIFLIYAGRAGKK